MTDDWILIGCPVYDRAWILPTWFEMIEKQTWDHNKVGFIFEASPDDEETLELLFKYQSENPHLQCFDIGVNSQSQHESHKEFIDHDGILRKFRQWNPTRYKAMINFRNSLLVRVQDRSPSRYFSLDSDILLENPSTLEELYWFTDKPEVDAAAPLCFMTPEDLGFPNVMTWVGPPGSPAFRDNDSYPISERFKVDVIMAAKMMTRETYTKSYYTYHRLGEDLGWSYSCSRHNLSLWSVSDIYATHVMFKDDFKKIQEDGDIRLKELAKLYPIY